MAYGCFLGALEIGYLHAICLRPPGPWYGSLNRFVRERKRWSAPKASEEPTNFARSGGGHPAVKYRTITELPIEPADHLSRPKLSFTENLYVMEALYNEKVKDTRLRKQRYDQAAKAKRHPGQREQELAPHVSISILTMYVHNHVRVARDQ